MISDANGVLAADPLQHHRREPLEPLDGEGMQRRTVPQITSPITPNVACSHTHGGCSESSPRRGSPIASPALARAHLSPRFRAERAILAMAQREISWHGPELWLVSESNDEVQLGPPVRDLPIAEDRALALVQRTPGRGDAALSGLLVISDGCIVGPWSPSQVRRSTQHAVCIAEDERPHGEQLPSLCSANVMATLADYAKRRLRAANAPNEQTITPAPDDGNFSVGFDSDVELDAEGEYADSGASDQEGHGAWDGDELLRQPMADAGLGEAECERERSPQREINVELDEATEAEDDACIMAPEEDGCHPHDDGLADGYERSADASGDLRHTEERGAGLLPSASGEGAPKDDTIVTADEFVRVARSVWMKTKEPRKSTGQREAVQGEVQHLLLRQEGADLRNLTASQIDEELHKPASAAESARGRWGNNQKVVAPTRLERPHAQQPNLSTVGRTARRLKSAEEGGPAEMLATAEQLQRLDQLRSRTIHARTIWQSAGAAEALRAVLKYDDPSLSLSILQAASVWLPNMHAAECAIALTLARSLLEPGMALAAFGCITNLLRAARERARGVEHGADGSGSSATLSAAKASLLRETRAINGLLEELRVPTSSSSAARGATRASTFEEQFAFGQALAIARQAARETWRALDSEDEAAATRPPQVERPPEEVLVTSSALRPSQGGCGRRAW